MAWNATLEMIKQPEQSSHSAALLLHIYPHDVSWNAAAVIPGIQT